MWQKSTSDNSLSHGSTLRTWYVTSITMRRKSNLLTLILILNVVVFYLWNFSSLTPEFMADNFLVSWNHLLAGRYWVLLTSVFSHNTGLHLLINMLVLRSFGSILIPVLGRASFLRFYIVAGIISSLSHAMTSNFLMHKPEMPALGASGSIAGLVMIFCLMFPKERIFIFGLIPIPAMFGALAFVGLDLWGLMAQTQGGGLQIGHGAHLGGAFTGLIYYFLFLRRRTQ